MPLFTDRRPQYDRQRWLEAGVSKHLLDSTPPEGARDYPLGFVLAQLLWFWRRDIPEPWNTQADKWDYGGAMRLVFEPCDWVSGQEFDWDYEPHKDAVHDALQKGN